MWSRRAGGHLGTYPVNQGTWNRSLPGDPNFGCPQSPSSGRINSVNKIEILALRAVALDAQGENQPGRPRAEAGGSLGAPGAFTKIFVDLGNPMVEMLGRLLKQGYYVETIHRILASFPADGSKPDESVSPEQPGAQRTNADLTLAEPFTPRELEVLSLLQGPSSVKEIAGKLHISYATAKRHTINIYAKLDVNQRWNVVARAEELNLLPPR